MSETYYPIFDGTPTLSWQVSAGGEDLVKAFSNVKGWTNGVAKRFEFYTKNDVLVRINNSSDILVGGGDELELSGIFSFVVVSGNVTFRYFAEY